MTDEAAADERLSLHADRVQWREVEGEVVALDLGDERYLAVNGSGALLWRLLSEGTTHADLTTALRETYGLEDAQATPDVDRFLESLDARGLLRRGS